MIHFILICCYWEDTYEKDINIKDMGKLGAISGIAGCMIAMLEKGDDGIPFPIWGGLGILIICLIAYIRDRKLLPIFFIGVSIFIMCIMGSIQAFIDVTPKTHTIWVIAGILQLLIILTIMVYIKGIVGRYKVEEANIINYCSNNNSSCSNINTSFDILIKVKEVGYGKDIY